MSELKLYQTRLSINQEKTRVDHPDIVGSIALGAESYRVALWHQTTRDGVREYYSGVLQLASDRSSPRFKLKLYEMRKAIAADPDYHSPLASPIGPHSLFAYLWIRSSKDPIGEIAIGLELRETARGQKLTEHAEEFRAHLRSKFNGEPPNEIGEPSNINF